MSAHAPRESRRRPLTQRLVERLADALGGPVAPTTIQPPATATATPVSRTLAPARHTVSRRGFLLSTVITATALTVNPFEFVFKPVSAYASICGSDGGRCDARWTAFCCTVNNGANTCPPGSYAAGWWKVDDSSFCRGGPRYYVDCNRRPDASCTCHCADGDCDRRQVCCNVFRYGQCNTHVGPVTEVVCRVVLCMPPWEWDPACGTTVRVEPATATHTATCLPGTSPTHIEIAYQDLGLVGSMLGAQVEAERDGAGDGRIARFENGMLLWRPSPGIQMLLGVIASRYHDLGAEVGALGYPTPDQTRVGDQVGDIGEFDGGSIYVVGGSVAYALFDAVDGRYRALGGPGGPLALPDSDDQAVGDGRGRVATFNGGGIWWSPAHGAQGLHGPIYRRYVDEAGPTGRLGYPTSGIVRTREGTEHASFEHGAITYVPTSGALRITTRRRPRNPSDLGDNSTAEPRQTRQPADLPPTTPPPPPSR